MLPIRQLPQGEFRFDATTVIPIRGLSRAEAIQLRGLGDDVTAVEILIIQAATGASKEEATSWHSATPNDDVERLIDEVVKLSGLNDDEGKADAGDLHSAKLTELIMYLQRISENLSLKSESLQAPK